MPAAIYLWEANKRRQGPTLSYLQTRGFTIDQERRLVRRGTDRQALLSAWNLLEPIGYIPLPRPRQPTIGHSPVNHRVDP